MPGPLRKISIPVVFFLLAPLMICAQEPEPLHVFYNRISPVSIQLSKYPHGTITWQTSGENGQNWTDIPGENTLTLDFTSDTSRSVRAVVLSGTCDTIRSQEVRLSALEISTKEVNNITDHSAEIACAIDTLGVRLSEHGIIYGDHPDIDELSDRITYPGTVQGPFSVTLSGLVPGVSYYACAYGKTYDGAFVRGNILHFTPIELTIASNMDIGSDTAWIEYAARGLNASEINQHGVFVSTESGIPEGATQVSGTTVGNRYLAIAGGLDAGSTYYITAFIRTNGNRYYYSDERKIKTWSEYNEPADTSAFTISHSIAWNDPSTARKISASGTFAEYGRIARLGHSDTLLLVYQGGPNKGDWINIYLRKSYDNGDTWQPQEVLMDLADYPGQYWRFCTPEIMVLQNGWVMVAFEANARPDENQSSVQMRFSKDSGQTWEDPLIYVTGRTWEPAMVQLPHGEIELFYSSEAKWWPDGPIYQDIQVIRSTDNGQTWSNPKVVAYYPEKRDGMPVPILLQGNKGVAFAIETVFSGVSPYIIHREMGDPWVCTTSDFENSPNRWLAEGFSGHGGAPYMLQLPSGEVVLSAHIYRGGDWHQNNYQQVMIGDNEAKNFGRRTTPWGDLAWGESAINNSLFLKDSTTIVTVTSRIFSDGSGGIYWLEGTIAKD